jgi:hypothetical protein
MSTVTIKMPMEFTKNELNYDEFIDLLSRKSNLDSISKLSLETE